MIEDSVSDELKKGCFLVNSSIDIAPHDKEIELLIIASQKEVEDAYYKAIKKGLEKGEINNQHTARALARFIMNAAKGIRVSARTTSNKKEYEDVLQVVLSLLMP
jgi:TetR/AcrR family transcriptional regulator, transcriptional repressor for nem operon